MNELKFPTGQLTEFCISEVHRLRGAYDDEGRKVKPALSYQAIAEKLGISLGTVYNIATGRTHVGQVPKGHPRWAPK